VHYLIVKLPPKAGDFLSKQHGRQLSNFRAGGRAYLLDQKYHDLWVLGDRFDGFLGSTAHLREGARRKSFV